MNIEHRTSNVERGTGDLEPLNLNKQRGGYENAKKTR